MLTRCNIYFVEGSEILANVYKHCDGYPDSVMPDLGNFFDEVEKQTQDTRFNDAEYLAAKYLVWKAKCYTDSYQNQANYLAFLGLGVCDQDHGDIEYIYTVDCSKLDPVTKHPTVSYKKVDNV